MIKQRFHISTALAGGLILSAGALSACGDDPANCPVVETWAAPDWDANTTEAIALREQLNTLSGGMRDVEEGTAVDAAVLTQGYEAGSPSLMDATSPAFQPIVDDVFAEFVELAEAGPADLVDDSGAWTPGDHGGIFGSSSRGINEGGLEVRQITDKGLFAGAALYRYAAHSTASGVDAAGVENIAAAFGADPALSSEEVTDSANYANSMGYFDEVTVALTEARGHADVADEACTPERDAALVRAFRSWELAMFARFVFYMNEAQATVAAEVTDDSVATASHQISEGIGLALGFYGLDAPASGPLAGSVRVATDAQIEAMMTAIGVDVDDLGASTLGELLVDPDAFRAAVDAAEAEIATTFGLTAAEVEAFRTPAADE